MSSKAQMLDYRMGEGLGHTEEPLPDLNGAVATQLQPGGHTRMEICPNRLLIHKQS